MKKSPVVHFEMPYKDEKETSEFYKKVFGWEMQSFPDMGNYIVATTTESTNKSPIKPGAINGGFFPIDQGNGSKYPSVVMSVTDIKKSMKDIEEAGGKIFGKPVDIPGVGNYVSFTDPFGNRLSILQARQK